MIISYPYPPKELSPNARTHWSKAASLKAKVKSDAYILTKASGLKINNGSMVCLAMTFKPATKARYDLDNALARCKALIDGISQAIDVDDYNFTFILMRGDVCKNATVDIEIRELSNNN